MDEEQEKQILAAIAEVKTAIARLEQMLEAISDGAPLEVLRKRAQYLDIIILREGDRAKVRAAIIQHTLAGLIWVLVAFIGVSSWEYVKSAMHQEGKENSK
jgi:hypothetical protein